MYVLTTQGLSNLYDQLSVNWKKPFGSGAVGPRTRTVNLLGEDLKTSFPYTNSRAKQFFLIFASWGAVASENFCLGCPSDNCTFWFIFEFVYRLAQDKDFKYIFKYSFYLWSKLFFFKYIYFKLTILSSCSECYYYSYYSAKIIILADIVNTIVH